MRQFLTAPTDITCGDADSRRQAAQVDRQGRLRLRRGWSAHYYVTAYNVTVPTGEWSYGHAPADAAGGCLLLASQSVQLDQARRHAPAELGLAVAAPADGIVVDDTGAHQAWLDELHADAALIGPDFAVNGTTRRGEDATKLADNFLTALEHGAPAITQATSANPDGGTRNAC